MLGAIGVFLCGALFEGTPYYARRIHLSCKSACAQMQVR